MKKKAILVIMVAFFYIFTGQVNADCDCPNTGGAICKSDTGGACNYTDLVICYSFCRIPFPTSCFPAGTKITLASYGKQETYATKNIENIQVGDRVVGRDENGNTTVNTVQGLQHPVSDNMCEIKFDDGESLKVTKGHPLFTRSGWKAIDLQQAAKENSGVVVTKLQVGDRMNSVQGTWPQVISITCKQEMVQTYNFTTDNTHTYFAGGFLAHNKGCSCGGAWSPWECKRSCGAGERDNGTPSYCGYTTTAPIVAKHECSSYSCNPCPTNTPIPTPTPPLPPINLTGTCSANGTSASVKWKAMTGATKYDLRINDTINGWVANCNLTQNAGDICVNDTAATSYAYTSTANHTYKWWVLSGNTGGWSATSASSTLDCCVNQAPTEKPVITVPSAASCQASSAIPVTWTFGSGWGNSCVNEADTFTIKTNGTAAVTGIGSASRTRTIGAAATPLAITVCAENGYGENCSAPVSVVIDSTAPPAPVPTLVLGPESPICPGRYAVSLSWKAVSDTGCVGMNTYPYWSQASTDSGYATVLGGWTNGWTTGLNQTSTAYYAPGTVVYGHVQARDGFDHQSGWSATSTFTIPAPSPYPTIHVSGSFTDETGGVCTSNATLDASHLTVVPLVTPAAVTPICTKTTTGYACDLTIDNSTGQCVGSSINLTMFGTYPGYGNIGWRASNSCNGAPVVRPVTAGSTVSYPMFFTNGAPTDTPVPTPTDIPTPTVPVETPTPTPLPVTTWFKVKDGAFTSRLDGRPNVVPGLMNPFVDGDADDSVSTHAMLMGNAGVLTQGTQGVVVGTYSVTAQGAPQYSNSVANWHTSNYTPADDIDVTQYIDYVESRRQYTKITAISQITGDGIYEANGPLTITDAETALLNGKSVVIIAKGNTISYSALTPTTGSLALVASTIVIDPTVSAINGILAADTVHVGVGVTPLKVDGNILAKTAITLDRTRVDASRPSLFVVVDTGMYMDLLPYFSVDTYDWQQT